MLKWAVNGPRQSYLSTVGESEVMSQQIGVVASSTQHERRRLRRKSSDVSCALRRKLRSTHNKENQLTSTPLPLALRGGAGGCTESPTRLLLGSLQDLSNITPEDCTTPQRLQAKSQPPRHAYASTLPTFDVEYSPCGLVPGPMLALRGIGIADTYFEKPRYLTQQFQAQPRQEFAQPTAPSSPPPPKQSSQPTFVKPLRCAHTDSTLSSSRMGDMTLERMIDAILESARKERKVPKHSAKSGASAPIMSPTYTPADDPASDLHECWDVSSKQYQQCAAEEAVRKDIFNEREVRSPLQLRSQSQQKQQQDDVFLLRRQHAVRRKRKMAALAVGGNAKQAALMEQFNYALLKQHVAVDVQQPRNISPDSGRNSCSDCEDSALEGSNNSSNCAATRNFDKSNNEALNATKRRLSFSVNDLLDC